MDFYIKIKLRKNKKRKTKYDKRMIKINKGEMAMKLIKQKFIKEGIHEGKFVTHVKGKTQIIDGQEVGSTDVKIKVNDGEVERILTKNIPHNYFEGGLLDHFLDALGINPEDDFNLDDYEDTPVRVEIKHGIGTTRLFENIVDIFKY